MTEINQTSTTDTKPSRMRLALYAAAAFAAVALVAGLATSKLTSDSAKDQTMTELQTSAPDLKAAAASRIFFGHQSVGENVISGIPTVYSQAGLTAPNVVETTTPPTGDGGSFAHAYIGQNGDPIGKIAAFESMLSDGMGQGVNAALMKLCYVDFNAGSDVQAIFEKYQQTMSRLETQFPEVTFIYTTVPLTTEPKGVKNTVKSVLGRGDTSTADNVVRQRYNELVRAQYADTGRLWDIAALESTDPSGARVGGTADGSAYFALYPGYAYDNGHLNAAGAAMAANSLMTLVGQQSRN